MRIALLANPGSGAGHDRAALARRLQEHGAEVVAFGCEADERERAAAAGPERLVLAGGDGTVGVVAELAGRLAVPLAVLPTGTANDFARANAIPLELGEAIALAATSAATRPRELGRLADGRPFVNVASAGLAALAARRAKPLKSRLGPLAYAVGALRAAATGRPLPCEVRVDGREAFAGEAWQTIVAVTGAFGGGSATGGADAGDGALDLVVIPAGGRLGLARRAWGLRRHTVFEQPGVEHHRGSVVEVRLPGGTEFNVDGELAHDGLERVTVEPRAFKLVVPESA